MYVPHTIFHQFFPRKNFGELPDPARPSLPSWPSDDSKRGSWPSEESRKKSPWQSEDVAEGWLTPWKITEMRERERDIFIDIDIDMNISIRMIVKMVDR